MNKDKAEEIIKETREISVENYTKSCLKFWKERFKIREDSRFLGKRSRFWATLDGDWKMTTIAEGWDNWLSLMWVNPLCTENLMLMPTEEEIKMRAERELVKLAFAAYLTHFSGSRDKRFPDYWKQEKMLTDAFAALIKRLEHEDVLVRLSEENGWE